MFPSIMGIPRHVYCGIIDIDSVVVTLSQFFDRGRDGIHPCVHVCVVARPVPLYINIQSYSFINVVIAVVYRSHASLTIRYAFIILPERIGVSERRIPEVPWIVLERHVNQV